MLPDILVVDDEADIRELLSDTLVDFGYTVRTARNSVEAFARISERIPSALILDIWLKDSELDGLGILETVSKKYPSVPVIIISGHGNIDTAVTSLKMGAFDYIEKPFKQDKLLHTVNLALETAKLKNENIELKQISGHPNYLVGSSASVTQLRQAIDKVAPTNSRVFISGSVGCGKESAARMIHTKSARGKAPFVAINTLTLLSDDPDKILFGTEDSSDLHAPPRVVGALEQADKGTLFIDEAGDIPQSVQGKFVRFLQDGTFERVGGSRKLQVDVRVISATSRDLQSDIAAGKFREDLYYRLNVVSLKMPALRERREDIPQLCKHFISLISENSKSPKRVISEDAIAIMQAYDWPGNIRQLRNVVEWLMISSVNSPGNIINSDLLPQEVLSLTPSVSNDINADVMSMKLREAREVFERQYLTAQINRFGGNISRTASFIGMERSALHRKLKMLDVAANSEEKEEEEVDA